MLKSTLLNSFIWSIQTPLSYSIFQYNINTHSEIPYADQTESIITNIEKLGLIITITSRSDDMIIITYYIESKPVNICELSPVSPESPDSYNSCSILA